ncbi:MAG: tRNA (adenosine(37)-N6)-threonylcarbamoyltransferase complex ATPase subunit type 1 TsaE [Tannerellaceae bacterium]|jgi:tRNA threonylcarbamoyladenosine biosynthesis protein TsaE|nr:tRNA (adenosine(37)-N6)-threonylcarbamoyltransferase complex ATPase subunit type 1 TsaE [Tannerellaceae bacterium]
MITLTTGNTETIREAAKAVISNMKGRTIFAFYGTMGVGKTTFIKAICEELGVKDTVNSPTFSIINEYRAEASGDTIYHFDFYRIDTDSEAGDLDLDNYFYSGSLCFIEWPEKIDKLLDATDNVVNVWMTGNPDGSRTVQIGDRP